MHTMLNTFVIMKRIMLCTTWEQPLESETMYRTNGYYSIFQERLDLGELIAI